MANIVQPLVFCRSFASDYRRANMKTCCMVHENLLQLQDVDFVCKERLQACREWLEVWELS